ncbi:MAG: ribonuclease P protein component [Candidatus Taylorbacteria bacterium]
MLKKTQRLTTEQVSAVMENSKSFHSPFFTLKVLVKTPKTLKTPKPVLGNGFAAIVSKKIAKTAVARNLARRRTYEALKLTGVLVKPGFQVIVLCKAASIGANLKTLTTDLKTLLSKAGVL